MIIAFCPIRMVGQEEKENPITFTFHRFSRPMSLVPDYIDPPANTKSFPNLVLFQSPQYNFFLFFFSVFRCWFEVIKSSTHCNDEARDISVNVRDE